MKIAILVAILGVALATIEHKTHKRDALISNAYRSYPVLKKRVVRAQPAIYHPPEKALTWVEDYYERTYTPRPYSFAYDVNDGYTHYGHQQQSDGSVTSGSYRVLLPDGRTQIVHFRADGNGYAADVKYEVSLFKSAGSSYRAAATASHPAPAGRGHHKTGSSGWTAFTAHRRPQTKPPSYKADLMAALGYPLAASAASPATALAPEYRVAEHQMPAWPAAGVYGTQEADPPLAGPPAQVDNEPTRLPEYKPAARPAVRQSARAVPAYPGYRVALAPVDSVRPAVRTAKAATGEAATTAATASSSATAVPAVALPYPAAGAQSYRVPSAPEDGSVTESAWPVGKGPVDDAHAAGVVVQAIGADDQSTAPTPQFRPWIAPVARPSIQTAGHTTAAPTPADRSPAPVDEADDAAPAAAVEDTAYERTNVPAQLWTTPSSQKDAAAWTAFRGARVRSLAVDPSTSFANQTPPAFILRSVPSDDGAAKEEANDAPTSRPSVDSYAVTGARPEARPPSASLPVDEAVTSDGERADPDTYPATAVTLAPAADPATPSAYRSPWAVVRPAPDASLYVAPTTYRPLTRVVFKVPGDEPNTGSKTSASDPAWNAWSATAAATAAATRPGGRLGNQSQPSRASADYYKLPPPLVYRTRNV